MASPNDDKLFVFFFLGVHNMDHLGCTLHNPRFADHLFLFLAGRRTLRRTSRKRNRCRPDRHEGTPSMIWWSTQSAHKVKAEAFCKNTRCCVAIWAGPAHEVMEKFRTLTLWHALQTLTSSVTLVAQRHLWRKVRMRFLSW